MKKTRFIALALIVAVALMGAGYAAWTDSIEINTTVNTGQLDVHFVDEAILVLDDYVTGDVGYAQDGSGDNDWDIANVTFSNMYPGAVAKVTLKIANNSTIPVKMNRIQDTRDGDWTHFNQIGASLRFFDKDGTPLEFDNTTTYANPWEPAHLVNTELPVGGYATLSFTFTANDSVQENKTYTFRPEAVFKQFNK
ncbi:hypothetical protein [Natronincola ferrireducens]|uniref:SipW-cognate class signal peptide n=1 Tax=Natronincola ferrireducens TaxID=393762 RepID=A0A1G8XXK4_9FIRM|nr:hypothetical protein [Natronincola ferrireducens]SDJ94625.1 hypothetical protein SAMN05660472_00343 [Natronincola ferrireducens]